MRAYRIIICTVWAITLITTALFSASHLLFSFKRAMYSWMPFVTIITFSICGSNIGIWKKFRRKSMSTRQQNRESQNKHLTKTLFVSTLALLSWIPLAILNCLDSVFEVQIPLKFYYLVNVMNYPNSFPNPVVYLSLEKLWFRAVQDDQRRQTW